MRCSYKNKEKRAKKKKETYQRRKGLVNRHHIKARSRGGETLFWNIILLDENKHAAYHLLFGNRTFYEASILLERADRIKKKLRTIYNEKFRGKGLL